MVTIKLVCKKHKSYKAKQPPKTECPACWRIFDFLSMNDFFEAEEPTENLVIQLVYT